MSFGISGHDSGGPTGGPSGMIAGLRAYWEALRQGDKLPYRDKVDPRGIANALEHSFLIERIAPGIARFRIAGMAYNDLMNMDIRGMPVSAIFTADARDALQGYLEQTFHCPAIVTLTLLAERRIGRGDLRARMAMLPMLDATGQVTLAIGCTELSDDPGRGERRFSITGAKVEPLTQKAAAPVLVQRASEFSESQTPFAPPPRAKKGVPHLRLVKR